MSTIREVIDNCVGAKIIGLVTRTVPDMNKGTKDKDTGLYQNRFIGCDGKERIYRVTRRTAIIGASYGSSVNRQLLREGSPAEFQPEKLWGGKGAYLKDSRYFVEHVGTHQVYLAVLPLDTQEAKVFWDEKNGNKPLDAEELEALQLWEKPPYVAKGEPSVRQGTEKNVQWRTFKIENILSVKVDGQEYFAD